MVLHTYITIYILERNTILNVKLEDGGIESVGHSNHIIKGSKVDKRTTLYSRLKICQIYYSGHPIYT